MSEPDTPNDGAKPGWLDRIQRVARAIVVLSGDAAKVADALRRIIR